jgi:NADH:ubiquinone oxidoreductase subunit
MNNSFLAPFTKLARQLGERGWRGTMNQLYTVGDIKFGVLKGTDNFGNKYYENVELPFGQHRWVEYSNLDNPDATMIQPEWHGWMHHAFDETPQELDAMERAGKWGGGGGGGGLFEGGDLALAPPTLHHLV